MSLLDYLNNDTTGASSLSAQMQLLIQQAAGKAGAMASATDAGVTGTGSSLSVYITVDAQRAAAEAADAKKSAGALTEALRKALDAGGSDAAMSGFSGRALALIALDEAGTFSKSEIAQAKAELRERDRASAVAFLNAGGVTAASLKAYSQQLLAIRETMSAEEQALRSSDPGLR